MRKISEKLSLEDTADLQLQGFLSAGEGGGGGEGKLSSKLSASPQISVSDFLMCYFYYL